MKAPLSQNSFGVGAGGAGTAPAIAAPEKVTAAREAKRDHLIIGNERLRRGEIQVWTRYWNGKEGRAVRFINAETGSFIARFIGRTLIVVWGLASILCFFLGVAGCAHLAFDEQAGWGSLIAFTPLLVLIALWVMQTYGVFRCTTPFYRTVELQFWLDEPRGNSMFCTVGGSCNGTHFYWRDVAEGPTFPLQPPPEDEHIRTDMGSKSKRLMRTDLIVKLGQYGQQTAIMASSWDDRYPSPQLEAVSIALGREATKLAGGE